MTKTELIQKVWEKNEFSRDAVETTINDTLDLIMNTLARGEKVEIARFGIFYTRQISEHAGRNIKTGEIMTIPQKKYPAFKAGKSFKEKVNHL